jgi:hypothetical protein
VVSVSKARFFSTSFVVVFGFDTTFNRISYSTRGHDAGRVFKAKVRFVIDAIAAGQLQATGTMQDLGVPLPPGGRALAILDIVDEMFAYQLPLGSAGEAAIFTDHFRELSKFFCACEAGRIISSSRAFRIGWNLNRLLAGKQRSLLKNRLKNF